jgi:hypothetical protein
MYQSWINLWQLLFQYNLPSFDQVKNAIITRTFSFLSLFFRHKAQYIFSNKATMILIKSNIAINNFIIKLTKLCGLGAILPYPGERLKVILNVFMLLKHTLSQFVLNSLIIAIIWNANGLFKHLIGGILPSRWSTWTEIFVYTFEISVGKSVEECANSVVEEIFVQDLD